MLLALGGVLAALILLAGPAGASVATNGSNASGGSVADNGSNASGDSVAINGSNASGNGTAINGSNASGCSTAINGSNASGGACAPAPGPGPRPGPAAGPFVTVTPTAGVATPTAASGLAFTGSSTGPLSVAALGALLLGGLLVSLGSERRRSPASS
jgi:hypothetical protein